MDIERGIRVAVDTGDVTLGSEKSIQFTLKNKNNTFLNGATGAHRCLPKSPR